MNVIARLEFKLNFYIFICVCVCVSVREKRGVFSPSFFLFFFLSLSLSIYIYIYMCVCVCVCVHARLHMCIFVHLSTQFETKRYHQGPPCPTAPLIEPLPPSRSHSSYLLVRVRAHEYVHACVQRQTSQVTCANTRTTPGIAPDESQDSPTPSTSLHPPTLLHKHPSPPLSPPPPTTFYYRLLFASLQPDFFLNNYF